MSLSLNVVAEDIARQHLIAGDSIESVQGTVVPTETFCWSVLWPVLALEFQSKDMKVSFN